MHTRGTPVARRSVPGGSKRQRYQYAITMQGHSKRHSITATHGVHGQQTQDGESISKGPSELTKRVSARAWQARGPGFESPMLHLIHPKLTTKLSICSRAS